MPAGIGVRLTICGLALNAAGQYYCKKGYGYKCRNMAVGTGRAHDSNTFLPGMFKPN